MTIVSHKHRLIFLRTRKTGSTSIEMALLPILGKKDFISTSTGAEPLERAWYRTTNTTTSRLPKEDELRALLLRLGAKRFGIYKHETAAGVRSAVRGQVWDGYHKVSVERHPYDRLLSMWQYRTRNKNPRPSLDQFVRRLEKARSNGDKWDLYSNWSIYAIGRAVVADEVIRYESLDEELPRMLEKLGMPSIELGRHKAGYRGPGATCDLLDDGLRRRIRSLYEREFETFGYEP